MLICNEGLGGVRLPADFGKGARWRRGGSMPLRPSMDYSPGDGARSWFTLFADAGLETCVKVLAAVVAAFWFGSPAIILLGIWIIVRTGEARFYRARLEQEIAELNRVLEAPEEERIRRKVLRSWQR